MAISPSHSSLGKFIMLISAVDCNKTEMKLTSSSFCGSHLSPADDDGGNLHQNLTTQHQHLSNSIDNHTTQLLTGSKSYFVWKFLVYLFFNWVLLRLWCWRYLEYSIHTSIPNAYVLIGQILCVTRDELLFKSAFVLIKTSSVKKKAKYKIRRSFL